MAKKKTEEGKHKDQELDYYEKIRDRWVEKLEQYKTGKRVIKFKELEWQKSRQGILINYSTPHKQDMAAPFWLLFINHIEKQSGKHIHQGGLPIFVLKGKGHSVVDGVRYNWKKGDLILLPIKPGGVEHQHFNDDPNETAEWLAMRWYPFTDFLANTTKQVEARPGWPTEK